VKIYVASSWRNDLQPEIVELLRCWGHDVYDFRNPPGGTGFSWRQTTPAHVPGTPVSAYNQRAMTSHPIALEGYRADFKALWECDALVYVLPCGRSASWEFGFAMGQGKPCWVIWFGDHEPELMFRDATIVASRAELAEHFAPVALCKTAHPERGA
jgi:hypothetical protein